MLPVILKIILMHIVYLSLYSSLMRLMHHTAVIFLLEWNVYRCLFFVLFNFSYAPDCLALWLGCWTHFESEKASSSWKHTVLALKYKSKLKMNNFKERSDTSDLHRLGLQPRFKNWEERSMKHHLFIDLSSEIQSHFFTRSDLQLFFCIIFLSSRTQCKWRVCFRENKVCYVVIVDGHNFSYSHLALGKEQRASGRLASKWKLSVKYEVSWRHYSSQI